MNNPKILIVFYSAYGHIYELVKNAAVGIKEKGGTPVIKIVEEIPSLAKSTDEYYKKFRETIKDIPVADPDKDPAAIDGLIIATPTRFGNMCAQIKLFVDRMINHWVNATLVGKPVSFITGSATQHGGQETTLISSMIPMLHMGCVIVGLPYIFKEQMIINEITGSSPYGVSTIAGGMGERMPSENEKKLARDLGMHLTGFAAKLMK